MGFFDKLTKIETTYQEKKYQKQQNRMLKEKLNRQARAEAAKQAEIELKELKIDEKNKEKIAALKAYKQKTQQGTNRLDRMIASAGEAFKPMQEMMEADLNQEKKKKGPGFGEFDF